MLDLRDCSPEAGDSDQWMMDADFSDAAKSPDEWKHIADATQRKKVQNRNAQRTYRHKLKKRIAELERLNSNLRAASAGANSRSRAPSIDSSRPATPPRADSATLPALTPPSTDGPLRATTTPPPPPPAPTPPRVDAAPVLTPPKTRSSSCDDSLMDPALLFDVAVDTTTTAMPTPPLDPVLSDGRTTLHLAVEQDQLSILKLLLDQRADVVAQDWWGSTALHLAATKGNAAAAALLLEAGAACCSLAQAGALLADLRDATGATALHLAAGGAHDGAVATLLSTAAMSCDPNAADANGCTPLHRAAAAAGMGAVQAMALLIDAGAHMDAVDHHRSTALHVAAAHGNHAAVRLLLDRGADVRLRTAAGWTALHLAGCQGHEQVVQMLLQSGAEVDSRIDTQFWFLS